MGKTNLTILVIGLGACLIMSFLMQRLAQIKGDSGSARVATDVNKHFGSRMLDPAAFEVDTKMVKGKRTGILTFQPQIPSAGPKLARDIGQFVWSMGGDKFDSLTIVVKRHPSDDGRRFEIERPYTKQQTPAAPASAAAPAAPKR